MKPLRGSIATSAADGSVGVGQGRVDRVAAHRLVARLDRRLDPQPAVADPVDAVAIDQLLLDVVEEVGLAALRVGIGRLQPEPALLGQPAAGRGDVAEVRHLREHLVAALARSGRVEQRVVLGGRLRQPGEQAPPARR